MNFAVRDDRIAAFLTELGANETVREELLRYNRSEFVHDERTRALHFPLADEPFVAAWERYAAEAAHSGVFATLRKKLIQFAFPIAEGMSTSETYLAATRRGVWPEIQALEGAAPLVLGETSRSSTDGAVPSQSHFGTYSQVGLQLAAPDAFELHLHPTPVGRLPILVTRHRADFETLFRALTKRNEPASVPASQGACMVAGYNNWDRIAELKRQWECGALGDGSNSWEERFARLQPQKGLYQDRFILLSDGGYSGVPASNLGLEESAWREISLVIRREHECAHYFTKRVFQSMRNLLLDEVIADFMGLRAAAQCYRADWFLRFMGLEDFPNYRQGGRLQNYLGSPPLSSEAFRLVSVIVKNAAEQLALFDRRLPADATTGFILMTLTSLSLVELAMPDAASVLIEIFRAFNGSAEIEIGMDL